MTARREFLILLYRMAILSVTSARTPEVTTREPYGPRMCEDLCKRTTACRKFHFEQSSLSCQVTGINDCCSRTHLSEVVNKSNKLTRQDRQAGVSNTKDRITKEKGYPEGTGTDHSDWFLVVKVRRNINILSKSSHRQHPVVQHYKYINSSDLQSVIAIPWEQAVLFAENFNLRYAKVNSTVAKTLIPTIFVQYMAVDEHKKTVFAISSKPKDGINSMDSSGGNMRHILPVRTSRAVGLALDAAHKCIYIGFKDRIFSVHYNGQNLTQLTRSIKLDAFVFDDTHNVIYFGRKYKLKRLSNGLIQDVYTYSHSISALSYYKGSVFTFELGEDCLQVRTQSNGLVSIMNVPRIK